MVYVEYDRSSGSLTCSEFQGTHNDVQRKTALYEKDQKIWHDVFGLKRSFNLLDGRSSYNNFNPIRSVSVCPAIGGSSLSFESVKGLGGILFIQNKAGREQRSSASL